MKKLVTALLVCLLGFVSLTFAQPYVNPWVLEQSTGGNAVRGMYSVGSGVAWAVGDNGLVMKRNGVSWAPIDLGMAAGEQIKYNFNCVQMQGVNGWIVGENKTDYSGILLRTISSGGGWTVVTSMPTLPAGTAFKSVSFSGGTGYIACANGIVLRAINNYGSDWVKTTAPVTIDPVTNPNGVSIWYQDIYADPANPNNVRVVADNYGILCTSTDGGSSWVQDAPKPLSTLPTPISYTWPPYTNFHKTPGLLPGKMGSLNWNS
jgi:photosystem II stability/assembly factor-like uncharacterized protein